MSSLEVNSHTERTRILDCPQTKKPNHLELEAARLSKWESRFRTGPGTQGKKRVAGLRPDGYDGSNIVTERKCMPEQRINTTMGLTEWGLLLALSIIWGGSFFFNGVAVKSLPPLTLVFGRVALAALALNLAVKALGLRMPVAWTTWRAFFTMGLLNNLLPFSLIVWGQTHITSGLASILNATTPVSTVIVAHFFTPDEKLTPNRLIGALVGLSGGAVIIGPEVLKGLGADAAGQMAVLAATVCYAFAGIFGRRFGRQGLHPVVTATGQVSASAVMLAPLALVTAEQFSRIARFS